jgi:hypothetical protein
MSKKRAIYLKVDSEFYSCLTHLKTELECSWPRLLEHLYRAYRGNEDRKSVSVGYTADEETDE